MRPSEWKWFGGAGHFICSHLCRFHLCTQVGGYLVSTVGEMWPERSSREIRARCDDPQWIAENGHLRGDAFDAAFMRRFGFETIGCDRLYETMVFKAGTPCNHPKCMCGIPAIDSEELDMMPSNTAGDATRNHMELCLKWSRKRK